MVNVSKVTPIQEYIIARHSRLVGRILDLVEAAVPDEVLKLTVSGDVPPNDET